MININYTFYTLYTCTVGYIIKLESTPFQMPFFWKSSPILSPSRYVDVLGYMCNYMYHIFVNQETFVLVTTCIGLSEVELSL